MTKPPAHPSERRPEYSYHLLRAASERFQTAPNALTAEQRALVERQARQTFDLESLVLSSPEARDTPIPEQRLDEAVGEIRQRYPDDGTFRVDLASNGLDETTLRQALHRELIFDAVMQRIGTHAEAVTVVDERLFYELHHERFVTPERRTVRHILITIQDEPPDNRRAAALARIERVAADLSGQPEHFGALARQYSECPTAMEDGKLGTVPHGRLFPELDAVLFALDEGQISGVVESELGFHLLLCEEIEPSASVTFEQARHKIRAALDARRRRDCQKAWLAKVREEAASHA
jgi:peptidyl-prolyl cis-trans isomerase C